MKLLCSVFNALKTTKFYRWSGVGHLSIHEPLCANDPVHPSVGSGGICPVYIEVDYHYCCCVEIKGATASHQLSSSSQLNSPMFHSLHSLQSFNQTFIMLLTQLTDCCCASTRASTSYFSII